MITVKGTIRNGVVEPAEPLNDREGQEVIVTILEPLPAIEDRPIKETNWDRLMELIERCQVDTGITDLAHQHDHYLYGTPK